MGVMVFVVQTGLIDLLDAPLVNVSRLCVFKSKLASKVLPSEESILVVHEPKNNPEVNGERKFVNISWRLSPARHESLRRLCGC